MCGFRRAEMRDNEEAEKKNNDDHRHESSPCMTENHGLTLSGTCAPVVAGALLKRSLERSDRTYMSRSFSSRVRANFRIARFRLLRPKHPAIGVGV